MIHINLVAERRRIAAAPSTGSRFRIDPEQVATFCLVATLLVGVLAYGGYWLVLNRAIANKRVEIAEAQAEVDRLQEALDELERFTKKEEELRHKISVITDLRDNQQGPVRVMDEISKALPDLLWLDRMNLEGRAVALEGRSFTTNAVATFIENLDRVEEFREPVLQSAVWNGRAYEFRLNFRFTIIPVREAGSEGGPAADESDDADEADGVAAAR